MTTSRVIKVTIVIAAFLAYVAAQAYFTRPKAETSAADLPIQETVSTVTQVVPQPVIKKSIVEPVTEEVTSEEKDQITALDPQSVEAVAEQGLATLERIRSVPGAAPLVDEIVGFLQANPYNEFSLDNLPTNEEGLVEVNEDTIRHMIRNDDIRAKWQKLMGLVAQYPEIVASLQSQGS